MLPIGMLRLTFATDELRWVIKDNSNNNLILSGTTKLLVGLTIGDTLISITALVLGILGIMGVLSGMPPAAAYTLVGVSGFITLCWIALEGLLQCEASSSLFVVVKYTLLLTIAPQEKLQRAYVRQEDWFARFKT